MTTIVCKQDLGFARDKRLPAGISVEGVFIVLWHEQGDRLDPFVLFHCRTQKWRRTVGTKIVSENKGALLKGR